MQLLIRSLFNDSVSISIYTASKDWTISEQLIRKDTKEKGRGFI
jgi:hypothetical protein